MRHFLAIAALISTGLLPGQELVQAPLPGDARMIEQHAVAAPDDATPERAILADAMRTAIRAGFPAQDVKIRLADIEIDEAGPVQRELHARGRILLDDTGDWIGFEARALYDLEAAQATTTSLQLDAPREQVGTVDDGLTADLGAEATRRLRAEFASQPARIEIGEIQSRTAGSYMALVADGQAHFGAEGSTDATVRALYDPRSGQWLRLDYELGSQVGSGG